MLTVSELARELNVSVQTIYRVLNSVKQDDKEILANKVRNTTYFTEAGENFIRKRLTEENSAKQSENEEILFLREQIKVLQIELKSEREHSRDIAEKLVELTRNSQVLLKQEQEKNTFLLSENATEIEQARSSEPIEQNKKTKKRQSWQFWKK